MIIGSTSNEKNNPFTKIERKLKIGIKKFRDEEIYLPRNRIHFYPAKRNIGRIHLKSPVTVKLVR